MFLFYWSIVAGLALGLLPSQWLLARLRAEDAPDPLARYSLSFLLAGVTPMVARLIENTAVSVAAAALGYTVGFLLQPLRPAVDRRPHRTLPAMAGLAATAAPRLFGLGAVVWSFLYLITKRRAGLSTLVTGLAVPAMAGFAYRSDLATILGGLFAVVLTFDHADELPVLFGFVARHPAEPRRAWRMLALRLGAASLVVAVLVLFFLNRYVYRGFGAGVRIFRQGNPNLPFIALTFDDGPDPTVTPAVLDALKAHGAKATFFMVGRHVEAYPDLARRVANEGHDIGNHTYTHLSPLAHKKVTVDQEFLKAQEAIKKATGVEPHLFRPPRGLYNREALRLVRDYHVTIVLWSRSSRDWLELTPQEMVRSLVGTVRNGDVILFHDGGNLVSSSGGWHQNLVSGLPTLLDELSAKGFHFVAVSDLMLISGLTAGSDQPADTELIEFVWPNGNVARSGAP